jgi:hypothetical protein
MVKSPWTKTDKDGRRMVKDQVTGKLRRVTEAEAAVEAREITLDFNRMGETGQQINSIYAFFNPSVQDIDKLTRNFREGRALGTSMKIFAYIVMPTVVNYLANKDDEEYYKLHEWDRMLFMHWKQDDGSYVRIPRPVGVLNALFGYGFQKAIEGINGEDPEAAKHILDGMIEQTPASYIFPYGADEGISFERALPDAFAPGAEIRANWDTFRQRPIIPEAEQDIQAQYQGEDVLGPAEMWLGKALGTSGYNARHLVTGYGATLGKYALDIANEMSAEPQPPDNEKNPFVRLMGYKSQRPVGFGSAPVAEFYQLAQKAEVANKTFATLVERRNGDEALRVRKENPEMIYLGIFQGQKATLAKLREARKNLAAATHIEEADKEELLEEIDVRVSQIAGMTVLNYKQYAEEFQKVKDAP